MNAGNKYAAGLLIAICLTVSCASSLSRTQPASTTGQAQQASASQSANMDDVTQIVQLTIDLPALQKFYHVADAAGRKPLLILKNEFVTAELSLTKFDEPVGFVTCDELKTTGKPYLEFTALNIAGDKASAVFRYRVEGIEGRLSFDKEAGAWRVAKQELVEAKFADRGCAPDAPAKTKREAVKMWLDPADAKSYEKLAEYMSRKLPLAYKVPSIAYALQKTGQFNRPRLRFALRWGQGPTVRVRDLVGAFGEFTPGSGSNEIRIQRAMVQDFEAGHGIRRARVGNVYLVGVTLVHELVHWCDDQDGIDRPGEEGEEFETLVYGRVIN